MNKFLKKLNLNQYQLHLHLHNPLHLYTQKLKDHSWILNKKIIQIKMMLYNLHLENKMI